MRTLGEQLDEANANLDSAQRACAEMRNHLEDTMHHFTCQCEWNHGETCWYCKKQAFLKSSDCGKDYVPRTELEKEKANHAVCDQHMAFCRSLLNARDDETLAIAIRKLKAELDAANKRIAELEATLKHIHDSGLCPAVLPPAKIYVTPTQQKGIYD